LYDFSTESGEELVVLLHFHIPPELLVPPTHSVRGAWLASVSLAVWPDISGGDVVSHLRMLSVDVESDGVETSSVKCILGGWIDPVIAFSCL